MAIKDIFGQPAAPRRLLICTGPCCDKTGEATALLEGVQRRLEEAKLEKDVVGGASCVRRSCLGKCTGEPLAFVHPDEIWYHGLSVDLLMLILKDHVLDEQPIPEFILEDED